MNRREFIKIFMGAALVPVVGTASAKKTNHIFATGHRDFMKAEYNGRRFYVSQGVNVERQRMAAAPILHPNGKPVTAGDIHRSELVTLKYNGQEFIIDQPNHILTIGDNGFIKVKYKDRRFSAHTNTESGEPS